MLSTETGICSSMMGHLAPVHSFETPFFLEFSVTFQRVAVVLEFFMLALRELSLHFTLLI